MESDISASVYKFRYWWNFNWIYGQKCGYTYMCMAVSPNYGPECVWSNNFTFPIS